ncbi:20S-pre-rRNA D-site endonuclease NOB1 [Pleurostoma richardsiae]|uniref:20S-pre-rRNA D-site endonuclease NOB1 n=1 Tax=Pleurostoma richardsiae TaxID=41990 RepID=A0AA38R5G3_9PEZI|nr:20S-pre-rRNA D-site endonuclease NOB1 [Pleurostoma richardsiae]
MAAAADAAVSASATSTSLEQAPPVDPSPAAQPTTDDEPQTSTTPSTPPKPIHSLVVDTGPLIKNEPPISTLLAQAEELWTIPSVLSEIRDEATRTRVDTTLRPFLKLRNPRPESVKFISDFARRTGDLEVLSKPDIHLLALTYELEIERNGGDWRLRNTPRQQRVNGKPPGRTDEEKSDEIQENAGPGDIVGQPQEVPPVEEPTDATTDAPISKPAEPHNGNTEEVGTQLEELSLNAPATKQEETGDAPTTIEEQEQEQNEASEDDDSDGWITPSNLKKHMAKDNVPSTPSQPIQRVLQAALITSDFAMQNVALRINLNLCSPSNLARVTQVKSWVLRCHGCFQVTRQLDKQFCPRCGQATLTRTSCSTDAQGNFRIHLKKNFQYNKRGNVYSIPKPTHGSASGKISGAQGGGKNGWGRELILAEDQKEYTRKVDEDRKTRYHDLMDADYLPNILTGERSGGHGRIRVGAGRNVNAKKRR